MSEYLRDSCTLKGGTGFPESLQGKQEGDLAFIKVSDMSLPGNEKFITNANNYVAHEVAAKLHANVFPPRATVFAKVGAALLLNRRRILTEPTIIDNNMMAATPTTADSDFLYYFLSSVDFGNYVQTGALPSVNQSTLGMIPFPSFQPAEQRGIAKIFSAIDEAIDQTEAMIAKTQQINAGLMHDLFTRGVTPDGHLRPPRAEAPKLYKESPLGWIPKEWEQDRLERWLVGSPKNGYSPSEVEEWNGYSMLGLGCLTPDGFIPAQLKNAPAGDSRVLDACLVDGDLLVSRANTRELVGLVGTYRDVGHPCSYPDLMMRIRPNSDVASSFLELCLRSPFVRRQIQANAVGTSSSMVKISGAIVRRLIVTIPEKSEQQRIVETELVCRREIEAEQSSARKLRLKKAGLMHDLLTGRVRVPVAELQKAAARV